MNAMPAKSPTERAPVSWTTDLLINGRNVPGQGAQLEVVNPATEEKITSLAMASPAQLDEAVAGARAAFESGLWADAKFRQATVRRFADLMQARAEELASAIVQEVGTPISISRAMQVAVPIRVLRYFADLATRDWTRELGQSRGANLTESILAYRPVGVVAAITAYNYPYMLACAKLAPLFAAGCTAVLLPSPQTPLTTLLLNDIFREAGFPPGVVNTIVGDTPIARALTEHPGVDKISFTGSVAVGSHVMRQAAGGIRDVVLELGGKSAAILLPECDFAKVSAGLHARYTRNAGQGCGAPTRFLVPRPRLEEFIELSRQAYTKIKVGDPWDPATDVGPLISKSHRARVERYVEESRAEGGRVAAGGGRPDLPRGWFMNPALIAGVTNRARIAREELFGPVGVVLPYENVEEAVGIANDSEFGLQAYVFGPLEQCKAIAPRLRVGTVLINGYGELRPDAPMGGFKQSGIGRERGEDGLKEFFEIQHVQWLVS